MADLQTILHFVDRFLNDSEHSHQFLFLRGTANELGLGKRIDRCRLVCFHLPRKLREVQSFDMRSRVKTKRGQHCQLATFHLPRRLICAQGLELDENNLVTLLLFVHIRTSWWLLIDFIVLVAFKEIIIIMGLILYKAIDLFLDWKEQKYKYIPHTDRTKDSWPLWLPLIFLMLRYLFMHTCTAVINAECLFDALVIVKLLSSIPWLRLFKSLRVRYCSRALESLMRDACFQVQVVDSYEAIISLIFM